MGGTDERSTARELLRKCPTRCHVSGFARPVRDLFRNNRWTSLRIRRCGRFLGADRAGSSGGFVGRSPDTEIVMDEGQRRERKKHIGDEEPGVSEMIRVLLAHHLR